MGPKYFQQGFFHLAEGFCDGFGGVFLTVLPLVAFRVMECMRLWVCATHTRHFAGLVNTSAKDHWGMQMYLSCCLWPIHPLVCFLMAVEAG